MKMKIAIVSSPWFPVPPPDYGGTELVCDLIARGLRERGHDVTLYATGDSSPQVRLRPTLPEHEPERHRHLEREGRHLVEALHEAEQYDVIHNNTTAYGALLWSLTEHPVVHTVHTEPDDQDARPVYQEASRRVPLVAISHAQREQAPELRWTGVIHNPIDVEEIPPRSSAGVDGDPDRPPYVVYLGRMAPEKGPDLAIVAARAAGVNIVLAGPAQERDYFKRCIEPHVDGDGVRHLDAVGGDEKWELLQRALALVVPSRWVEPFGLAAVEAMAAGVPVVAFRTGGSKETVIDGETGFLVDDEREMAQAVGRVDEISPKRCREHVAAAFSPASVAERYERVLEREAARR